MRTSSRSNSRRNASANARTEASDAKSSTHTKTLRSTSNGFTPPSAPRLPTRRRGSGAQRSRVARRGTPLPLASLRAAAAPLLLRSPNLQTSVTQSSTQSLHTLEQCCNVAVFRTSEKLSEAPPISLIRIPNAYPHWRRR